MLCSLSPGNVGAAGCEPLVEGSREVVVPMPW